MRINSDNWDLLGRFGGCRERREGELLMNEGTRFWLVGMMEGMVTTSALYASE